MKLGRIIITLKSNGQAQPDARMGSLFHGWLMTNIDEDYAGRLHNSEMKPFSQYIAVKGDRVIWHVSALNEEACEKILVPLLESAPAYIRLKHNQMEIPVETVELETAYSSYKDVADQYYLASAVARTIKMRTITPVSFRSNGLYQIIPNEQLMFKNLINRWNLFADAVSLKDDDLLPAINDAVRISRYTLISKTFPVEGMNIPGFYGTLEFKIKGSNALGSLVNMLAFYAGFSGIGIKTAMGMGAVHLQGENER